jgi:type IV pilus assembly protein PilO
MAIDIKNIDFKTMDLKNIYEWPFYGRMVIFAIVCAGVFAFGYFFDFSALSDQIVTRYKQEQDLKQQMKAILRTEESMKEVVKQFPEILKLLSQWQGQLINSGNLPDLLNQILKLGAANHIQFSLFAPGAKKQEDDYFMVPLKVVIRGNYNQVSDFISQVANLAQIVSIGDFVMAKQSGTEASPASGEKATDTGYLVTALTLEVYYLAPKK